VHRATADAVRGVSAPPPVLGRDPAREHPGGTGGELPQGRVTRAVGLGERRTRIDLDHMMIAEEPETLGCTAYELAGRGLRTLCCDRADAGRATDAGAGIIKPHSAGHEQPAMVAFSR